VSLLWTEPRNLVHVLFACEKSHEIWSECLRWVGTSTMWVMPRNALKYFLQFLVIGNSKEGKENRMDFVGVYNVEYMEI